MKKKVGIIKRVLCLGLVFLLSINSFAAIVSDNDGSAFITKAEFDALKSSFQAQIDSYNKSIDSKIDGAIASYLSGIRLSTTEQITGGFSDYSALKFYNRYGIYAYTYNTRTTDAKDMPGGNTTDNLDIVGTYTATANGNVAPQSAIRDKCKSYVFDFYGSDETMSRVNRAGNGMQSHIAGLDHTAAYHDQMGLSAVFRTTDRVDPWPMNGALSIMLKLGGYGYFGGRHGYNFAKAPNSRAAKSIGEKGFTSLAGFAPATADADTVQWLIPGANWVWFTDQPDFVIPTLAANNLSSAYGYSNYFSLRLSPPVTPNPAMPRFKGVTSGIPDGYALALQGSLLDNGTEKNFYLLVPDTVWALQNNQPSWYNTDPTADYRIDSSITMTNKWNYKPNLKCIFPTRDKLYVDDVMLAFNNEQNLYVCKYGVKNDKWPLSVSDLQTGSVDAYDENITWMGVSGNSFRISTLGSTFTGWSVDNLPEIPATRTGADLSLKLPSYQMYDHLQNYNNYKSVLAKDPLKINGGIRIGKINTEGTAEYKLKVSRSSGNVTSCKIYLKKSPFTNSVPAAADCITGSWDGGSGAICGVSPKSDGTLTLTFPAVKDDEIWIMVSPESRPTGAIAVTDTSYAYAQLVQCEGTVLKEQ